MEQETMEHLLTFEVAKDDEQLFVHGDPSGLRLFAKALLALAEQAQRGEPDHVHLMVEEWGGAELSSEPQALDGSTLVLKHVKVLAWPGKGTKNKTENKSS